MPSSLRVPSFARRRVMTAPAWLKRRGVALGSVTANFAATVVPGEAVMFALTALAARARPARPASDEFAQGSRSWTYPFLVAG